MKKNDVRAFAQVMTALNEVFGDPAKSVTDLKNELYFSALQDLTIEQLNKAVNVLCNRKTIKTFPLPAEIRDAAIGNLNDMAEAAFEVMWDTVKRVGSYYSVEFQDGVIAQVVALMGGWEKVCKLEGEMKWIRKEFCDIYSSLIRRGASHEPQKCIGIAEGHNSVHVGKFARPANEYELSSPVKVGNTDKQLRLIGEVKK